MILYDHFNVLIKMFCWTGLAPFTDLDGKLRWHIFIFSVVVSSLINISLIVIIVNYQFYELYGSIQTIVNYAFIGTLSLSNLSANIQCYNYKATYRKIIQRITKIERNFNSTFSVKTSFQTVAHSYRLKALIISILYLIALVLQFYESWL